MRLNTTPTVITDKNGKITTVHKKDASAAVNKSFQSKIFDPLGIAGRKERSALIKENLASLASLQNNGKAVFGTYELHSASQILGAIKDNNVHLALQRIISKFHHSDDLDMLRDALSGAESGGAAMTIRLLDEYSSILEENPGSAEKLYRLEGAVNFFFGDPRNPDSFSPSMERHLLAKIAFPHGMNMKYSTDYEMATDYFNTIEARPDLFEELTEYVRYCKQDQLDSRTMGLLTGVADEMPDQMEKFMSTVKEHGVGDALNFMEQRNAFPFNKDAMSAYLETHNAVNEGWL